MTSRIVGLIMVSSTQAFTQRVENAPLPPPVWNSPQAVLKVGSDYSHGNGVPQDYAFALRCFQRAAQLGSTVALYNIGTYYAVGNGVPADRAQALVWLHQAAARGYAPAMNSIGVVYSSSFQGKPDHCQALIWYRKAAEHGDAAGMENAGRYYRQGLCPGTRNPAKARQLLQNAVDIGSRLGASNDDKLVAQLAAQELTKL